MNFYLIEFEAETFHRDWVRITRLVFASSYENACLKILEKADDEWEYNSPHDFKNLTIL